MNKLMRNRNVQRYIDGIKGEWSDLSDILFKDLFTEDQVKLMESILENINELCRRFKAKTNTSVESNNVTDVVEEADLVDRMDTFVKSIKEFNENTEEIMEQLDRYER